MGYLLQLVLLSTVVLFAAAQDLAEFQKCDWCGEGAKCSRDRECICPQGMTGDPYFYCVSPSITPCVYCNDPVVQTQAGQTVLLHHAGVALFYETELSLRTRRVCFRVYVVTYRIWGKIYARCVWVVVIIKNIFGRIICWYRYKLYFWYWRIRASGGQGHIGFKMTAYQLSNDGSSVDDVNELGSIRTDRASQKTISHAMCSTRCNMNFKMAQGHRHLTVSSNCFLNTRIIMRPHVEKSEWLKSGVAVLAPPKAIKPWGDDRPTVWYDQSICLNTDGDLGDVQADLGLNSHQDAISYIALTHISSEVEEFDKSQEMMARAIRSCDDSTRAGFFEKSRFIYGWSPFIKCISSDADDANSLEKVKKALEWAAKWFCHKIVEACRDLLNEILDKCSDLLNMGKYPQLDRFVATNCSTQA